MPVIDSQRSSYVAEFMRNLRWRYCDSDKRSLSL
jgi:hypothetical protein